MALFGGDYDSSYRANDRYGRSYWSRSGEPLNRRYDLGYGSRGGQRQDEGWNSRPNDSWDRGFASRGYGRDFRADSLNRYDRGFSGYDREFGRYDRPYKSQWQTDHGDPFGDRQQQTPMRVVRNRDDGGSWWSRGRDYDRDFYDRDFRGNDYPMGYRPYSSRAGYDVNYEQRLYRTEGRGYDRL